MALLPANLQLLAPRLIEHCGLSLEMGNDARTALEARLMLLTVSHPQLREHSAAMLLWCLTHGREVVDICRKLELEDMVFTSHGMCCQCGGRLQVHWQTAVPAKALSTHGVKYVLHVPSLCQRCDISHWHHSCSGKWTQHHRPGWGARVIQGRQCTSSQEWPFLGEPALVRFLFLRVALCVEVELLQKYERLLYRGAMGAENFFQVVNDEHGRIVLPKDNNLKIFRAAFYRFALLHLLAYAKCLKYKVEHEGVAGSEWFDIPAPEERALKPITRRILRKTRAPQRKQLVMRKLLRLAQHGLLKRTIAEHPGLCTCSDVAACVATVFGDGNSKLFTPVCPAIDEGACETLAMGAGEEPLCLPCGDFPLKTGSCACHRHLVPTRPPNRRRRIMPYGAGTQKRRYCVHNRNEPDDAEKKWWVTAGHIALSTSCGLVLAIRPMFWHESHAQVFSLLREVAEANAMAQNFGYDDACHFAPWVRRKYGASRDATARRLAREFDYFIDKFHF